MDKRVLEALRFLLVGAANDSESKFNAVNLPKSEWRSYVYKIDTTYEFIEAVDEMLEEVKDGESIED